MEDYHTHFLGKTLSGNLFWGYQTFYYDTPYEDRDRDKGWQEYRIDLAVMHHFDSGGKYLNSQVHSERASNSTAEAILEKKLEEFYSQLSGPEFCDIEVELFQSEFCNVTFGLVYNTETDTIDLQPSSTISFAEPWDGEYYT